MTVSQEFLEAKIADLNEWLLQHENENHFEYAEKKHNRDYYVTKLIELHESGLDKIKLYEKP